MGLKERLIKNSSIKETAALENSRLWAKKDMITTDIPALNIALSGSLDGGMCPGMIEIAGKSKTFKSKFAIEIERAFLKKFKDGVVLFYDSEWGTPNSYFDELNTDNIIHTPITEIEELTVDVVKQLDSIEDNDKLLVVIDSLGNLASRKEVTDALKGEDKVDLTRAKKIKALYRMIGPRLPLKEVYMVVVNHTYDTIETYSKEIVGGGTGTIYNANGIWIITSSKNRDSEKELEGFDFNIKIDKSRFVKQDTRIPITVSFDKGIDKWSGLLDIAIEGGFVIKLNKKPLQFHFKDKPVESALTLKQIGDDFYMELLKTDFPNYIKEKYQL